LENDDQITNKNILKKRGHQVEETTSPSKRQKTVSNYSAQIEEEKETFHQITNQFKFTNR
jgi:hypothetical protein